MMDDDPRPFVPSVDLDALGSRTQRSLGGGGGGGLTSPRSPTGTGFVPGATVAASNQFKFLPDFFPSNPASPIDTADSGDGGGGGGDMVDQMLSQERGGGAVPAGWAVSPSSSAAAAASPFVPSPSFGSSAPNFSRGGAAPRSRFAAVGASSFGESSHHHTPSSSSSSSGGSLSGLNARRDRRAMFDESDGDSPFATSSSLGFAADSTCSPGAPQMVSRRLSGASARSSVAASPALSYSAAPSSTSSRHSSLRFGSPMLTASAYDMHAQSPAAAMRSLTLRER